MKINKFENGMNVTVPLLINTVTKGVTQNGAPYLSILFQDNTGNIEGKWWDVNPELEKLVVPGAIATVKCDVLLYRQNLQIRVQGMNFEGDYQVEEFSASSPFEKEF
ncbi:MAG: 3'-5' exonuclease, partial [Erysipelothrix sp.]|nr:3'-5' exonuclease [Erysipelothrix sp.]